MTEPMSNLAAIYQLKFVGRCGLVTRSEKEAIKHAIERLSWFAPGFTRQLTAHLTTEHLQAEIDRRRAEFNR